MSIWTQVFLINWIVIIAIAAIDRNLLNNKIEWWVILSFVSIPAWLIYLVVS